MCSVLTEYNEAETMRLLREEAREEGREEGRKEGREEGRREALEKERREGEERLRQLLALLLSEERMIDVQRAVTDKEARMALYREFRII